MARMSGRAALVLSDEQRSMLSELAGSRTASVREVERAGVLLKYAQGMSISEIQRLSFFTLMAPPIFGLMAPLESGDLGARTG